MLSNMSTKTNTPSVPFVDQYLSALLNQAAQLITVDFHAVVKRRGLSLVEWRVLASLYEHDEVSIGQLAQLTLQKQPTLSQARVEAILEDAAIPIAPGSRQIIDPNVGMITVSWGADATGKGLIIADRALLATQ